ncbi:MAG TPA: ABC transporter permease subunit, partial [Gemmataceae bacterium]|nr:ABC transporter permease subunit [Gemmataceae bacterium]
PFSLMTTVGSTATPPDATLTMTEMVLAFVVVHGTIACICLAMAVARVRPKYLLPFGLPPRVPRRAAIPRVETVGGWDPADIPAALPARPTAARRNALDLSHALPPQIGDEALLWKEMHHGATVAPVLVSMTALLVGLVLVAVVFIAALVVLADVTDDRPLGRGIAAAVNPVIRVLSIVLAGMWCFGLAFRAVSAVSRERDQRTLDSLLILPVERSDILRAKWLGSILRLRGLGLCLLAVWGVGLITGALHPLGLVLLASACAIHVAFLASLGIWVSLVSRNTLTAYFAMAMMILVIFVGSWSAQNYSQWLLGIRPDEYDPLVQFFEIGLNPPRSWWFLGLSWHEMAEGMSQNDERLATAVPTVLAGLLVYLSAAWILWLASCWRFQREDSVGSR